MGSADRALELLLTEDDDRAWACARELEAANEERRRTEERILGEALGEAEACLASGRGGGIVVGRAGWHVGAIGIVAARLCERYGCPAAVIAYGEGGIGRGSCRSVKGVDVVKALRGCSDLLGTFGGHPMAAGFTLQKSRHGEFFRRFDEVCEGERKNAEERGDRQVDAWLTAGDLDAQFHAAQEKMKPFGFGNPAPVWGIRGMRLMGIPRRVGKDHLKACLGQGGRQFDAIGFGMAGTAVPDGPVDVLFHLRENNYLGRATLELRLQDLVAAQEER